MVINKNAKQCCCDADFLHAQTILEQRLSDALNTIAIL